MLTYSFHTIIHNVSNQDTSYFIHRLKNRDLSIMGSKVKVIVTYFVEASLLYHNSRSFILLVVLT